MSRQESSDRPPLTRDRILQAAVEIADADGLSAVTMRKLAASLGVEAMSLYNHVGGKKDLMTGMVDTVAGEFVRPGDGPWRDELHVRAHAALGVLMRHPWAPPLILANAEPGPNMLAYVEATLGCLVRAGFDYPTADHAWNAMDAFIYGFASKELAFPFAPEDYARAAAENMDMIPADTFPHLRALAGEVAARRHDGIQSLDFGLGMILDGLERLRS